MPDARLTSVVSQQPCHPSRHLKGHKSPVAGNGSLFTILTRRAKPRPSRAQQMRIAPTYRRFQSRNTPIRRTSGASPPPPALKMTMRSPNSRRSPERRYASMLHASYRIACGVGTKSFAQLRSVANPPRSLGHLVRVGCQDADRVANGTRAHCLLSAGH